MLRIRHSAALALSKLPRRGTMGVRWSSVSSDGPIDAIPPTSPPTHSTPHTTPPTNTPIPPSKSTPEPTNANQQSNSGGGGGNAGNNPKFDFSKYTKPLLYTIFGGVFLYNMLLNPNNPESLLNSTLTPRNKAKYVLKVEKLEDQISHYK